MRERPDFRRASRDKRGCDSQSNSHKRSFCMRTASFPLIPPTIWTVDVDQLMRLVAHGVKSWTVAHASWLVTGWQVLRHARLSRNFCRAALVVNHRDDDESGSPNWFGKFSETSFGIHQNPCGRPLGKKRGVDRTAEPHFPQRKRRAFHERTGFYGILMVPLRLKRTQRRSGAALKACGCPP